jgi:hypothetical protein
MVARLIFSTLLLGAAMAGQAKDKPIAAATQPPARVLTPQQQVLQTQLNAMSPQLVKIATQVAQLVDQNKIGDVWDNASSVARGIVTRDAFIKQVSADRTSVGPLKSRQLSGVSISISDGTALKGSQATPAGTYINVVFATRFGTNAQPVRELVSFHLDADQDWRVTGYTLR